MYTKKHLLLFVLIVSACFQMNGCARYTRSSSSTSLSSSNGGGGDPPPPPPPPDPCSVAGVCSAVLIWDPSTVDATHGIPDGYKVYTGLTSGAYTNSYDVALNLTYSIPNFPGGSTYYFAVTAYNGSGESPFSGEASKTFLSCCTTVTFTLESSK